MKYKTEQEEFWAGEFGTNYISRNNDPQLVANNVNLFSTILCKTAKISSIIELGANIGLNLLALKCLVPFGKFTAVEINKSACLELKKMSWIDAHNRSILSFHADVRYDLVFSKGVLIHINPDELNDVYNKLYTLSKKYILIAEYYNPTPVEVIYRGHSGKLFKRDFAGELMNKFDDLRLVDYGFSYHRDNNFKQDDLNWFLLEKPGN